MSTTKTIYGSADGSALTLYKGYPQLDRDGGNWTVTYRYWCQLGMSLSLIPAANAACPFQGKESLLLRETHITANGAPGMCDVELVYKASGVTVNVVHKDGDEEKSCTVGWMEIPLDDARLVTSGLLTAQQVKDKIAAGYQTHGVGTIEYTYTEYLSSFTWSESNLTSSVGDTEAPAEMTSATASKWMLVGLNIREQGDVVEKSRTWRFNKLGWKP